MDASRSKSHRNKTGERGGRREKGNRALHRWKGLTLAGLVRLVELWYGWSRLPGLDDLPVGQGIPRGGWEGGEFRQVSGAAVALLAALLAASTGRKATHLLLV